MSKQTFDFSEALRRMKEGKKVRRICYGLADCICLDNDKNIAVGYSANKYEQFEHIVPKSWHFFSLLDVLATDWEEVEG